MPGELIYLKAMLDLRLARARSEDGASAVEWVVITAILVGIAIALGATIKSLISDKANSINLDTP